MSEGRRTWILPGRIMTLASHGNNREPGRWLRWMPGLRALLSYEAGWLRYDLVAGLVLATMLVPVGIAYAAASGLPGIYGLYATIVPLLIYAVFGPSRILVLGPDSALAAVLLSVVLPLSAGDPQRAVILAGMMALVSGTVCILAGFARLGFVTELLSKPIRYGYMNGIALTVLISQLPKIMGFSVETTGPLRDLWSLGARILDGRMNWVAFATGAVTLAVILLLRGSKRVPGILVAVVGAAVAVGALDLAGSHGVAVLGPLPQGLPRFAVPWIIGRRHHPRRDRRLRRRPRVVRRHERSLTRICRADGNQGRSQSGTRRTGSCQSCDRLFSGLPDQQQQFAHSSRGGGRSPHATDRHRQCDHYRSLASVRSRSPAQFADPGPRGCCHCLRYRVVRDR